MEVRELTEAPQRARRALTLSALTAVASVITTLVVAAFGSMLAYNGQISGTRQHEEDVYSKIAEELGSTNATTRAAAIVGLEKFSSGNDDRALQTTTILATQVVSEKDPGVLRVLIPALISAASPAMDEIVQVNRGARERFVAAVRSRVISSLRPISDYAFITSGRRGYSFVADADDKYSSLISPIIGQFDPNLMSTGDRAALTGLDYVTDSETLKQKMENAYYWLAAGQDGSFGLSLPVGTNYHGDDEDISTSARQIFVTNIVINGLVKRLSGKLKTVDLRKVALPFANFQDLDMSGVNMEESFISGDAKKSKFTGANFNKSDVRLLMFNDADLSFVSLTNAALPSTIISNPRSFTKIMAKPQYNVSVKEGNLEKSNFKHADLTGANWWDARLLGGHGSAVGMLLHVERDSHLNRLFWYYTCPIPISESDEVIKLAAAPAEPDYRVMNNWKRIDFSLSVCPPGSILNSDRDSYERAFGRESNESKRVEWCRRRVATEGTSSQTEGDADPIRRCAKGGAVVAASFP
jgi:hypothetical protein